MENQNNLNNDSKKPLSIEAEAVLINQSKSDNQNESVSDVHDSIKIEKPNLDSARNDLEESLNKVKDQAQSKDQVKNQEQEKVQPQVVAHINNDEIVVRKDIPLKEENVKNKDSVNDSEKQIQDSSKKDKVKDSTSVNMNKKLAPTKISKEKSSHKNNFRFLSILALVFSFLFIAFIVLMVLVIASGGVDSPVLSSLGLSGASVKTFLLNIINLSFGFFCFLFFILSIIALFKIIMAPKKDVLSRRNGIKMFVLTFLPLLFILFVWLFLYSFISRMQLASEIVKAEILVLNPKNIDSLEAPVEVTFSAANVVKALARKKIQISGLRWDFDGDGVFDLNTTDLETSYLYNLKGNYNVVLEVISDGSDNKKFNYFLQISDALFYANPSTGTFPLEVEFDAKSLVGKDKKISSFEWDFDEDSNYDIKGKDKSHVTHTFEKIGKYKVHLRVIDSNNVVENYYRVITVEATDQKVLSADIQLMPSDSGLSPFQVKFDASNSSSLKSKIVRYEWDFGDSSPAQSGKTTSHIYKKVGTYTALLKVWDKDEREDESSVEIKVLPNTSLPEAKISINLKENDDGIYEAELPFNVKLSASDSIDADNDIVDYKWALGSGFDLKSGENIEYTYDKEGEYSIMLTVIDSEGNESTDTLNIKIIKPKIKVIINTNKSDGVYPLIVDFDASTSTVYNGEIKSYEWDFGDGSSKYIGGALIQHKYNTVGNYNVKLKVTSNDNLTAEGETVIYVREVPLSACFTSSRSEGNAPLTVSFDSKCSSGNIKSYSWDFGDSNTSNNRKPNHTFEVAGTYNVKLELADEKNNVNMFSDIIVVKGEVK